MSNMTLSIRMTLVIVALVAATTVGILYFINKTLESVITSRALVQIETHARLLANRLEDKIDDVKDDVVILSPTSSLNQMIRSRLDGGQIHIDGTTNEAPRERIEIFLNAVLAANPSYLKFNIIGVADGGREILRVDRLGPEQSRRIVPSSELQSLGDTDFFLAAIKLKPGQVYVSPIQYVRNGDAVVFPTVPVMLVATPIFAPDGSPFGVIAVAVDARQILGSVRSGSLAENSIDGDQIYVVNDRGEYLVDPDHALEIDDTYKSANRAVKNSLDFTSLVGVIRPLTLMLNNQKGESFEVAIAPVRPAAGAWFGVIVTVPRSVITAPIVAVQKASIFAGLVGIFVAIVLAALLGRSITKPLVQMTRAVDAFKPGMPILMPEKALATSGEIGVLAHAFEHMAEEVTNKNEVLRRENEQRVRMKDEFVAMVSHELRTPLTSIAASLGLLVADPAGTLSDPAKRLLRIAHNNSQRLVRLINDILDMEKIESGKIEFHLSNVNILPMLEQVIESNRGLADQFGVTLRLDPGAIDAVVRADSDRITQVVTNLLSNAVKFSPHGSEVLVTAVGIGPNIQIGVRDHGPGIPEEFKARIFEKFAQADSSDARQKGGTGLGLNIVKQIVERLGGQIGFEAAPGGGTIFHVALLRYDMKSLTGFDHVDGAQILLCADDPVAAALICEQLHKARFHVDVAFGAEEAVRGSASRSYEAIVVDLQLPDNDAVTLIKKIRSQWHYQNTPVIALSVDPSHQQDDDHGSIFNVLDWLSEPLDIERLGRILNRPMIREAHPRPRILHFDGDRDVLRLAADYLKANADVVSADTVEKARRALAEHAFDHAVIEVNLGNGDFGIDLLPDLRDKNGRPISAIMYSIPDRPEIAVGLLVGLAKSPTSMTELVTILCQIIAGRSERVPMIKEVA